MSYILSVLVWFLVAICILVAIHEYGHFIVARRCGVKVLRFSIGFGPRLFAWSDRSGTEFALCAIPLGGYVKMLDENEKAVPPDQAHMAFNNKKPWQKILIAFAGPLANFILALFLFFIYAFFIGEQQRIPIIGQVNEGSIAQEMGLERGQLIVAVDGKPVNSTQDVLFHMLSRLGESGELVYTVQYPGSELKYQSFARLDNWLKGVNEPDPIGGLGFSFQGYKPIIANLTENMPASSAGFQVGDLIVKADDKPIYSWTEWQKYVQTHVQEQIAVLVERSGNTFTINVTPELVELEDGSKAARVGMSTQIEWKEYFVLKDFGVGGAFTHAAKQTWNQVKLIALSFKKIVLGEISIKNLSGPVGIAKVAGDSAIAGIWQFISFLAIISVSLGVMNLLPVPVLDGGHIIYGMVEWVKGSPVSKKAQMLGYQVGLVMILCLMVVVIYNDIVRLANPA